MGSLGNCYLFVEAQDVKSRSLEKLAKDVSDISGGLGTDGMIVVDASRPPFVMRIFNRDGSQAQMCGNGLGQAALFLKRLKYPARRRFLLAPPAGQFETEIVSLKGNHALIKTTLGTPDFLAKKVGLTQHNGLAFGIKIKYGKQKIIADCVSIGNPHAVICVDNFEFDWQNIGYYISCQRLFRHGVNVQFLKIINSGRFEMRIYERGSGVTKACGSGAAACLAVGVMRDFLGKKAIAIMPGGRLKLSWDFTTGMINQIGPADIICNGVFYG